MSALLWVLQRTTAPFGIPAIAGGGLIDYSKQCYMEYIYIPSAMIAMMCIEFLVPLLLIFGFGITLIVGIRKINVRIHALHPVPITGSTRCTANTVTGDLNRQRHNTRRKAWANTHASEMSI